eukprot:scaffold1932_cov163-Pinguiococcus_pyrenoidosus.AAC.1
MALATKLVTDRSYTTKDASEARRPVRLRIQVSVPAAAWATPAPIRNEWRPKHSGGSAFSVPA